MQVTEIIVNAGRTFNHPYESYSNLRPSVTLKASLGDGEDFIEAAKELQAKAEGLVEDHKQHMLKSLEDLHDLNMRQQEVARLEQMIRSSQAKLDQLRDGVLSLPEPEQLDF